MNASGTRTRGRGRGPTGPWIRAAGRTIIAFAASAWILGIAMAQLDVDPAAGPLTLPEEVAAAFDAWRDAFPDELTEPTATVAFAPELVGPDTASLTLRWEDGRTDVLLAPERYRSGPVLVHEIGVLLGLPEVGPGVMDPVLTAESPSAPTSDDLTLLRDLFTYPPADLTRDGVVDFYDLAAFGAAYGSVGINLRADLTGDGRVDDADLAALREAYAFAAPSSAPPSPANLTPQDAQTEPPAGSGDAPPPDQDGENGESEGGDEEPSDEPVQEPPPPGDPGGGDENGADANGGDETGGDANGGDASNGDPP